MKDHQGTVVGGTARPSSSRKKRDPAQRLGYVNGRPLMFSENRNV